MDFDAENEILQAKYSIRGQTLVSHFNDCAG